MNAFFKLTAVLTAFLSFINPGFAEEAKDSQMLKDKKILIAYYSWSGNTKEVAEIIQKQTNGTLFRIETLKPYPEEYRATTAQAKQEINDGYRPELKDKIADINQYDIIFIGSPNWWGTIAPAVSSFLASYDLNGKTVIPFITHGGGGVQNTIKDLTAQCKGCNIIPNSWIGYSNTTQGLNTWIENLNI